jgi:hypothetical protein
MDASGRQRVHEELNIEKHGESAGRSRAKEKARFVGEPITPDTRSADVEAMARAEPGLPRAFEWRKKRYTIVSLHRAWRTHGTDRGDTYVRRHWFDVETTNGMRMRIYFDRNPGRSGSKASRWWLYAIDAEGNDEAGSPG